MHHFLRFAGLFVMTLALLLPNVGCEKKKAPKAPAEETSYQSVSVEVSGMGCAKGCAPRAKDALAALPWAKDVKIEFEKKLATFMAETARYDEAAILKALSEEGFEGKILKASE